MEKTKFTEEQIAFALRQAETDTKVDEVCWKMGICEATFSNWKKNRCPPWHSGGSASSQSGLPPTAAAG